MTTQLSCIVWTRPGCSLCFHVVERLKRQGAQVEERKIDGFNWRWDQFKAASPNWSNTPVIQLPDGRLLTNIKEVDAWIGPDPEKDQPKFHPSPIG